MNSGQNKHVWDNKYVIIAGIALISIILIMPLIMPIANSLNELDFANSCFLAGNSHNTYS